MSPNERAYYESRAEAELDLAQRATSRSAARAHYELLTLYLDRLYPSDNAGRSLLRSVEGGKNSLR